MQNIGLPGSYGLDRQGLHNLKTVYWNLVPAELIEQSILNKEGYLSAAGSLVVNTGKFTGRSPGDKYISKVESADDKPIWWGKINQPIDSGKFQQLYQKIKAYLQQQDVYVQDLQVGAHPSFRVNIRVITEKAWASLFSYNLFRRIPRADIVAYKPDFTVIHCPDFHADPTEDGVSSATVIAIDFERRMAIIGGTGYAGEIKKAIFSVMNYFMPQQGILSMHCSANVGITGDVALFFGLSGTGKTTLSSDPDRRLIGDDEHGWADDGVFNFEGGCYAKTIRLSAKLEPLIWQAVNRFGCVVENVAIDTATRQPDFEDFRVTENTRAAYPLEFIPNYHPDGYAGHPQNIFFLTADAFGLMPPIAKLTEEQAMYYFLSGYTSKIAGTEKGLGSDPQATFSACFGAPFLPLNPQIYAALLGEKIKKYDVKVWLINTGWTGGPFGIGHRILLSYTRAMIKAALTNQFNEIPFHQEKYFGLWIPETCPGVPKDLLEPEKTWTDRHAYSKQAKILTERFYQNYRQYEDKTPVI